MGIPPLLDSNSGPWWIKLRMSQTCCEKRFSVFTGCLNSRRPWSGPGRPLIRAAPNRWNTASPSWRTSSACLQRDIRKSLMLSRRTSTRCHVTGVYKMIRVISWLHSYLTESKKRAFITYHIFKVLLIYSLILNSSNNLLVVTKGWPFKGVT